MAGWGMGPEPFLEFRLPGFDILICYDYRSFSPLPLDMFTAYQMVDLLSWSMGVWVANRLFADQEELFRHKTALAGTLFPLDKKNGINPLLVTNMTATLNKFSLSEFYAAMFTRDSDKERFMANPPCRSLASLREELAFLTKEMNKASRISKNIYNHIIITRRDRIFSFRNQMRAWDKNKGQVTAFSHYPFYEDKFIEMLLEQD